MAEDILAQRGADGFPLHIAFLVQGRHGNARYDGLRLIEHVPLDAAALGLGSRQGGSGQNQNEGRRPSTAPSVEWWCQSHHLASFVSRTRVLTDRVLH